MGVSEDSIRRQHENSVALRKGNGVRLVAVDDASDKCLRNCLRILVKCGDCGHVLHNCTEAQHAPALDGRSTASEPVLLRRHLPELPQSCHSTVAAYRQAERTNRTAVGIANSSDDAGDDVVDIDSSLRPHEACTKLRGTLDGPSAGFFLYVQGGK